VPTTGADPAIDQEMSDQEMLDALRSTFSALDKWRDRLANAAAPPEWSALGELDRAWPYVPPTQMALVGLCTAREHLHAIRRLIDSKELFPSATSTLARAALVGAAQTVWCLEYADQVERLRRSLTLVREDYRNHKRFGDYVLDDSNAAEPEPTAADDVARLEGRLDAVERLLDFLGGAAPHKLTNHIIPIASAATEGDEQVQGRRQHALAPAIGFGSRPAGGGVVESYPQDTDGKKKASFLYNATRSLFEQAGFTYHPEQGLTPFRDAQDGSLDPRPERGRGRSDEHERSG